MIIGGLVFGLIVGFLSDISRRSNMDDASKQTVLGELNAVLAAVHVEPEVVNRCRSSMLYQLDRMTAFDLSKILRSMPSELRYEVASAMNWIDSNSASGCSPGILHKVPFMYSLDKDILIEVASCLQYIHFSHAAEIDDVTSEKLAIMQEGGTGQDMYIVVHGSCGVERFGLASPRQLGIVGHLGTLGTGDFFGEVGVLLPPSQVPPRSRSVYALEETELAVLCYDVVTQLRAGAKRSDPPLS